MVAVRSLLAAAVLTAAAVGVGVAMRGWDGPNGDPDSRVRRGTPLSAFDTAGLVVARSAFCSGIGPDPVLAALGAEPASSSSYGNGERAAVTAAVSDVAHEFDCTWRLPDGTEARAWVFAPPVTTARAKDLATAAVAARGCERPADAPAFGTPTAALVCTRGDSLEASYRGLFGDAWLACSITAPTGDTERADLVDRTGRWCVAVARAASGTPD
jgi:hypothetical protein